MRIDLQFGNYPSGPQYAVILEPPSQGPKGRVDYVEVRRVNQGNLTLDEATALAQAILAAVAVARAS